MGISQPSEAKIMDQSGFWSEEHLASLTASQDSEAEWMMRVATSPSNISAWLIASAPDGFCGRTCPEFLAVPKAEISLASLADSAAGTSEFRVKAGKTAASSSKQKADTASHGELLTLSTLEFHSDAGVSSLSDILETGDLPQRYFLSSTACKGILRRAEKRGKDLPEALARLRSTDGGIDVDHAKAGHIAFRQSQFRRIHR
jgi:hypothetical protein